VINLDRYDRVKEIINYELMDIQLSEQRVGVKNSAEGILRLLIDGLRRRVE